MKRQILILTILFITILSFSQFKGASGVYYLGSADIAIPVSKYSNPTISGVVCRFKWESCEPTPGTFNWSYIDGEIQKAKTARKKISLQPLAIPAWMKDIPNIQQYYSIDNNQYHSTFGKIITDVIPWYSAYLDRVKLLLQQLSLKYSNDTTVAYINAIGGQISRGLPDSVLNDTILKTKAAFWKAFPYNADNVANAMLPVIDYYMTLFPKTALWCSVDYVSFEPKASGKTPNYLASLYCNYGITNYPDRFGLWREDIAGCTIYPALSGNQWRILQNYPERTGGQMLWSVQDGPTRMNKCGITPNTKQEVLDSAVNKGLTYGMRYIEIYGADIDDNLLSFNIQVANNKLIKRGEQLNSTGIESVKSSNFNVFPNPANDYFTVDFPAHITDFKLIDVSGRVLIEQKVSETKVNVNCKNISNGMYFLQLNNSKNSFPFIKIIISK